MSGNQTAGSGRELRPDLLRGYLNDHLTAIVATRELARRVARAHSGMPSSRDLDLLPAQIGEDHDALLDVMHRLDVPARRTVRAWLPR